MSRRCRWWGKRYGILREIGHEVGEKLWIVAWSIAEGGKAVVTKSLKIPSRWAPKMILQAVSEARNATTNNYLKALKVRRFLLRSHQQPVRKEGVKGFYNDE